MAKAKYDGVVEGVRYLPNGQVAWVRAYLRRGATFSDRLILDRQTLVQNLKSGKRYLAGKRVPLMASTFETSGPLRIVGKNGEEVLVTGDIQAEKDCLEGVPLI
jgi:hypothetical protein